VPEISKVGLADTAFFSRGYGKYLLPPESAERISLCDRAKERRPLMRRGYAQAN
jgi:hypothetical protein